tara:strand:- start:466 stop:768 length:303 start_codon:yes stop_codon:yes gene_type:complete
MSEAVKFTEEETKNISEIRRSYQDVQIKFGEFALYKIKVEEDFNALNELEETLRKEYKDIQTKEKSLVDELTKKYGTGTLNPQTGDFTPDNSQKTEKKSS